MNAALRNLLARCLWPLPACGLAGGLLNHRPNYWTRIMQEMKRDEILAALAAPFPESAVKWKPTNVSGNRALALAFIDARAVMDRLDAVLGLGHWSATYREAMGGVICALSVRIEGEWIIHEDFGGLSAQPDAGDKHKAAFSAALKRAAVHLGIGRYLYRLPRQWADYDPQKRCFTKQPVVPDWAKPAGKQEPKKAEQKPAPAQEQPAERKPRQQPAPQQQAEPQEPQRLTRPPEDDQDPAEIIGPQQVAYLLQTLADADYNATSILKKFKVKSLKDLSLADYRFTLDAIERSRGAA